VPSSSQRQLTLNPIPLRRHLVSWSALGAKLGAILCGFLRTAMDVGGIESPLFRSVWTAVDGLWTAVDGCGHRLEIYGSEGWGSNSQSPPGTESQWRVSWAVVSGVACVGSRELNSQGRGPIFILFEQRKVDCVWLKG